jgi:hypothetical protein
MSTTTDQALRSDDAENGGRAPVWRRIVGAPVTWARVLLFPFETVPRVVAAGRVGAVLFFVMLCAGLAVAASATRLDMAPGLLKQEAQELKAAPPPAGQARGPGAAAAAQPAKSDREFDEAVEKAYAVEVVKMSGRALLLPLRLLLLGFLLYVVLRFVGGKPKVRAAMALAAHAGLPGAVKSILAAVAALRQVRLTPEAIPALVPPPWGALDGPPLQRLLAGTGPFALWTVVLLGIGLPHVAGIGRGKAWAAIGVCYVLYLLVTL